MSSPLRIAVIGAGAIAELYHLPALQENSATRDGIVLVDTSPQRLKKVTEKFTVAETLEDYRELAGRVDAVIVATPPTSHFAICKWCLENDIHVLCEKPLTEDVEEARILVELAEARNLQLGVNQTRRFFPTYQKIRELIQEGKLGELKSITYHDGVEFDWPAASPHHFLPGAKGAWSDTGVHLLDTVCYWLDGKPTLVNSLSDSASGPEAMATVRLRHEECDIEIKVSRLGRLMNGFKIVGTEGTIEQEAEEWSEVIIHSSDSQNGRRRFKCGTRKTVYTDFARPMLANFVDAIRGNATLIASGKSTLATVELLDAAYREASQYYKSWNEPHQSSDTSNIRVLDGGINRVLITGASGFLGGRVAEVMHLSATGTPVSTVRKWSRAARVARYPMEIQLCDINDQAQIDASVSTVDAIVHCAKTDDRLSIVDGTKNLLEASARHGVKRFVFLSTAEVYGPDVSGDVSEETLTQHTGRDYGDFKIDAENLCRQYADRIHTTILRPSLIYGPFSTSWTTDIAKRILSGNWGQFEGHGEGFANLVYVDDLVHAILRGLEADSLSGEAFNINGPDVVTWNEYFALFNDVLDLPPLPTISSSKSKMRTWAVDNVNWVVDKIMARYEDKLMEIYLRGGWMSRLMKRVKGELKSTPSGGELHDLFSRKARYMDAKARHDLGYAPQVSIKEGLHYSVDWLRLHEVIPSLGSDRSSASTSSESNSDQVQELVS